MWRINFLIFIVTFSTLLKAHSRPAFTLPCVQSYHKFLYVRICAGIAIRNITIGGGSKLFKETKNAINSKSSYVNAYWGMCDIWFARYFHIKLFIGSFSFNEGFCVWIFPHTRKKFRIFIHGLHNKDFIGKKGILLVTGSNLLTNLMLTEINLIEKLRNGTQYKFIKIIYWKIPHVVV